MNEDKDEALERLIASTYSDASPPRDLNDKVTWSVLAMSVFRALVQMYVTSVVFVISATAGLFRSGTTHHESSRKE